jgi:hypothetical protein
MFSPEKIPIPKMEVKNAKVSDALNILIRLEKRLLFLLNPPIQKSITDFNLSMIPVKP